MKDFYASYTNHAINSSLNIDFSNKCILQCVFCMRQRPDGKEKIKRSSDMSFEDFKKVAKTFHSIHFCGQLSDPIYHPDFLKCLQYASKNLNNVSVHTNGSGKKTEFWNKVFSLPNKRLKWVFGIDGIDQKTVQLHRIGQDFRSAFRAMLLGARKNQKIYWQFIPFKHNEHQIHRAVQVAKKYNINFTLLKSNRWNIRYPIIVNNKKIMPDWIEKPSEQYLTKHNGEPTKDIYV